MRRLYCREHYVASAAEAADLGFADDDGAALFRAAGCERCDRGYRGRVGVHQLMVVDEDVRRVILARGTYEEIAAVAATAGMRTLWDDGLEKALAGLTSVEELRRVLTDLG